MKIQFHPIGIIRSPFTDLAQMPIQPTSSASADGYAQIYSEYREGLKDLDGFSHIILLFYLHRVTRADLTVTPFLDREPRGVFATRAPTRPNPIGLSVVKLAGIEGARVHLSKIDILDGTPLLDIKPYIPDFDHPEEVTIGWLEKARNEIRKKRSDDRFK